MHDPRLGRFFQLDPLASIFPHNSPYAFAENSVIGNYELEGLEKASIHDIELARNYAQTALGNDPNGTSKNFLGITKQEYLAQIDARLNALIKSEDITNVGGGIWFCGPTAIAHVFLWFEPMEYVKAAINLFENGSTIINGRALLYFAPEQDVTFNGGQFYGTDAIDFAMISSLRSTNNEVVTKQMDLHNHFHVGTLPWELDNMASNLGLPTYHRNSYLFTNIKKIEKDIKAGKLVVLLDNGELYSGMKQNQKGIHYITVHNISVDREKKEVSVQYWEHGKYNDGLSDNLTYSFKEFRRAVKAQYSIGKNEKNDSKKYYPRYT